MAVNREIATYYNTLTYIINNLKVKQRAFTTNVADPNDESVWDSPKGWVVLKDLDGDSHVLATQKYYDSSAGAWVNRGNKFGDVEADQVYTDTGLRDQYLSADLPVSETGEAALDGGFSASSIVGCLNELKSGITPADTYWSALTGDTTKPKSPFVYIHTASGLKDDYATGITVGESGQASLDGSFSATSIIGALNELAAEANVSENTGWPVDRGATISWDDGNMRLTVTDSGSDYYFMQGTIVALGGNHTVDITDTEGMWFIYFNSAGTLTASQTPWDIEDNDKAMVAIVYWDADNNKSILTGYEMHDYVMDASTHRNKHLTTGALYSSGLAIASTGTEEVNATAGYIFDEDIPVSITDGAGGGLFEQVLSPAELPIYYRNASLDWRIFETTDKARATDVGYVDGSNDLKYDNAGTLTTVGSNNYVAMYAIATSDISEPVALVMGQRVDNTLADAKENNSWSGLNLTGIPAAEIVVLARIILVDTNSGVYYTVEDIQDLRNTIINGANNPTIQDHGGLVGLGDDDHSQYLLLAGRSGQTIVDEITESVSQDAETAFTCLNGEIAGTYASATVAVTSASSAIKMLAYNSTYTGGGSYTHFADSGVLLSESFSSKLAIVAEGASAPIEFYTGGKASTDKRMTIDSAGNFGLGSAVSSWSTNFTGIDFSYSSSIWATNSSAVAMYLSNNIYIDAVGYKNKQNAVSSLMTLGTGGFGWYCDPAQAPGALTPTLKMLLDSDGKLGIGVTPTNFVDIQKDQNAATICQIKNDTGGTAAHSAFIVMSNSCEGGLYAMDDAFDYTEYVNKILCFANTGADALALFAAGASSDIEFYTGGVAAANKRATIDSAGKLGIGITPTTQVDISVSQASQTALAIRNQNASGSVALILDTEGGGDYAYLMSDDVNDITELAFAYDELRIRDRGLTPYIKITPNSTDYKINTAGTGATNLVLGAATVDCLTLKGDGTYPDVYTTAWTNYSSSANAVGFSGTPTVYVYYKLVGKLAIVHWNISGTSNSVNFTFDVPWNPVTTGWVIGYGSATDNGSVVTSGCSAVGNGSGGTIILCKSIGNTGGGNWTGSGAKASTGTAVFEIS